MMIDISRICKASLAEHHDVSSGVDSVAVVGLEGEQIRALHSGIGISSSKPCSMRISSVSSAIRLERFAPRLMRPSNSSETGWLALDKPWSLRFINWSAAGLRGQLA